MTILTDLHTELRFRPDTLTRWATDDAPPRVSVTDCHGRMWLLDYCCHRIFLSAELRAGSELSDALDEGKSVV